MSFSVVIDKQEKTPWELSHEKVCATEVQTLKTGDYTVKGYEDILTIERKKSIAEICTNVFEKRWPNFINRLGAFPYSFFIIEASADDVYGFPHTSNLPARIKRKIKVSGNYIMSCLNKIQVDHGINVIFAGNRENAQRIAINIMEQVLRKENG